MYYSTSWRKLVIYHMRQRPTMMALFTRRVAKANFRGLFYQEILLLLNRFTCPTSVSLHIPYPYIILCNTEYYIDVCVWHACRQVYGVHITCKLKFHQKSFCWWFCGPLSHSLIHTYIHTYYEFLTIKEPSGHQVVVFADGCLKLLGNDMAGSS